MNRDAKCNYLKTKNGHDGIRLCSTWWDAVVCLPINLFVQKTNLCISAFLQGVLPNAGLEELIMGLSSQIAEREDSVLCSDVRGKPSQRL